MKSDDFNCSMDLNPMPMKSSYKQRAESKENQKPNHRPESSNKLKQTAASSGIDNYLSSIKPMSSNFES
jgi:hypothetical protein